MREYTKQEIGRRGERVAARYLKRQGYRIIAKNKHLGKNELDLVAKNKHYVVFVEVKTRSFDGPTLPVTRPADAVDCDKRTRTVQAATAYLKECKIALIPRFDVVEVITAAEATMKLEEINHIMGAYEAGDLGAAF